MRVHMSRNLLLLVIRVWGVQVPARCHCVASTTVTLGLTELTNYLEYSPSLEASSCSVKKFPIFHPTRMFITTCTTARDLSLFWARTLQSTTHHYIFRSILISSHRRLGLPSGLFPSGFLPPIPCTHLFSPLTRHMPPPVLFFLISSSETSGIENPFSFRQGNDAFSLNQSQVHSCVSSKWLSGLTLYHSNLSASSSTTWFIAAVLPSAPAVFL